MPLRPTCIALACLAALGSAAQAQTSDTTGTATATLEPVVITVNRREQRAFDAAAAVSAVEADTLRQAGPQVNLSEALVRVPGIAVLNRQNYAQDLQLSIRGFGSRSTFGIRGVRLIVDGIPATMPDGQGQASTIVLGSAQRIEVLRGPLAQLYGNAAGGVVQVISEVGAEQPTGTFSASAGTYGTWKAGFKTAATLGNHQLMVDASQFATEGFRDHSRAQRGQLNARWRWQAAEGTRLDFVANGLDQPDSQDPIGLTRALWEANPKQVAATAITQNAGKTVRQNQLGAVLDQRLGDATTLTARVYGGTRDLNNALSVPANQPPNTSPTGSGGMVVFERLYSGTGLQVAHRFGSVDAAPVRVTVGVDRDGMNEDRQGYQNLGGTRGLLKRDEYNKVRNRDLYVQVAFEPTDALTGTLGVRRSRVEFTTEDRFIRPATTPPNPDDSGNKTYSATNPVLGFAFKPNRDLNLYANVGRGFETPTFTELAYRPDGLTGLNLDLKASRSRHSEVGAKWRSGESHRLDVAWFNISTTDEIITNTNQGGRTTFTNAGRTSRRGMELAWNGRFGTDWRATLSNTLIKAKFDDETVTRSVRIPAGKKLPGVPQGSSFAELAWAPREAWAGFNAGIEVVRQGRIYVNDLNDDSAPAATVMNLRLGFQQKANGVVFRQILRVDNATDRSYAGSVIVNDGNQRYFEPAPGRTATLMLSAQVPL